MRVLDSDARVGRDVAQLAFAIDREATAAGAAMTQRPSGSSDQRVRGGVAEREELWRQLTALRDRAVSAESDSSDLRALRSELATLLSFARTLRSDAEGWRAAREAELVELERQRADARLRRERWVAEHQEVVRRREALQCSIDETASDLARVTRGECRRTVPVLDLGGALTVCSVTVLSPRRVFHSWKLWLVTLDDSCDQVLVRRC
jgi:chromosome segregation ATPase